MNKNYSSIIFRDMLSEEKFNLYSKQTKENISMLYSFLILCSTTDFINNYYTLVMKH